MHSIIIGFIKYTYHEERVSYADAQNRCQTEGQSLAMPKSEAEHQAMLLAKPQDFEKWIWLGMDDIVKEGEWVFNDGTKLNWPDDGSGDTWARWVDGNPDNWNASGRYPEGEDCVKVATFGTSNEWNDASCTGMNSFACQGYTGMYMYEDESIPVIPLLYRVSIIWPVRSKQFS